MKEKVIVTNKPIHLSLQLLLLVLQHHVVIGLQTDAGSEDVDDALSLLRQRIHHRRALGHFGRLQQVAQNRED